MSWQSDEASYICDGCLKPFRGYPKWEKDTEEPSKTYHSVGCAVWDGWNPIDNVEVVPNETKEVDKARRV